MNFLESKPVHDEAEKPLLNESLYSFSEISVEHSSGSPNDGVSAQSPNNPNDDSRLQSVRSQHWGLSSISRGSLSHRSDASSVASVQNPPSDEYRPAPPRLPLESGDLSKVLEKGYQNEINQYMVKLRECLSQGILIDHNMLAAAQNASLMRAVE